jgi:hypothetical protein
VPSLATRLGKAVRRRARQGAVNRKLLLLGHSVAGVSIVAFHSSLSRSKQTAWLLHVVVNGCPVRKWRTPLTVVVQTRHEQVNIVGCAGNRLRAGSPAAPTVVI